MKPAERIQGSCHSCGTAITGAPLWRRDEDLCCEGCYLQRHRVAAWQDLVATGTEVDAFAEALAAALDLRERETGTHSKRVACHTLVLARRFTSDAMCLRQIYWGALLHDIGKIGIPDAILLKHSALTAAEEAVMRTHPEKGFAIIQGVPLMSDAAQIVLSHQERYDGSGYPRALAGDEIPLGARLFAVIDTLDAITSDRPYRTARSFDRAKAEIAKGSGAQFDPQAVDAFLAEEAVLREMVAVKCGDPESSLVVPIQTGDIS